MHKLVFTILVHGLPDAQAGIALDVLAEALGNPNSQVRELAVVALAELPVSPAKRVAALSRAMKDTGPRVRRRAARALGDFGAHSLSALPLLVAGLRDTDASVRRDCAGTLGRLGPAAHAGAPLLVAMLADPETRTRVVAATALKRIGRGVVPALVNALRHADAELRGRCATLLGTVAIDDDNAIDALRAATDDRDADVRDRAEAALEALAIPFAALVVA
ncbi:MAG TPA: HEAT repeat domain-containing protein [Gemmataceae bacterium]|nr:HEAT repeat domain-containing protein [Gemmataceae bacterium]